MKPLFSSSLAPVLDRYVGMKRALGRKFDSATHALQSLDRLLVKDGFRDLSVAAFDAWCKAYEHLASGVRRVRMLEVHAFCLYRRRTEPECFLPDPRTFPPYHQRIRPHIFTESEVARLLDAASRLNRNLSTPLRPELTRLAIVLLFTTGIRRGELLNLVEGDYNRQQATLHIRATKFYKARLLPIHEGIANEIDTYLSTRARLKLPSSPSTPLIWNAIRGGRAYTGTGLSYCIKPLLEECGIKAANGFTPRIHDFRHSFAVNALLRWYRAGTDVDAKLPLLATYLGHGSALSTHHYLHFIEPMRVAASERFARLYGTLVIPPALNKKGQLR
ncbi:MAG TPA: tyrosine-type recombinase/integrase [Bryobacteraceae bacterium]|nr:tyrosine-type recombinase/integrase [Bryobacteraceae bacterium]